MPRKPELRESEVSDEKAKRFVRDVNDLGNGKIYIYTWNVDKSPHAPICLMVDPSLVTATCFCLEELGAQKTEIKDGVKFDLTTATGYQGSHMELYDTGRHHVNLQWGD